MVGVNAETGVMELKPVSDDRVVRSETTQVTPEALPVTYAQLASGDYESMYVSLDAQVVVSDLNKVLSDNVTVQTADDEAVSRSMRGRTAPSASTPCRSAAAGCAALRACTTGTAS